MEILRRDFIYIWYYFSIQLEQVFFYWVLGMVIGSAISVFGKGKIHSAFQALGKKKPGVLGLIPASLLGIASPLCMYGTIPIAASFSQKGMKDDMLAAFMMSSNLLNPQLLITSGILGAGYHRGASLRIRRRYGSSAVAVARIRHEHRFCGGVYDHRTCDQDYQSGSAEDRAGGEKICPLSGLCDPYLPGDRTGSGSDSLKPFIKRMENDKGQVLDSEADPSYNIYEDRN